MDVREEVACPTCGETILAVARKCKHCGEWLSPASNTVQNTRLPESMQTVTVEAGTASAAAEERLLHPVVLTLHEPYSILRVSKLKLADSFKREIGEIGIGLRPLEIRLPSGNNYLRCGMGFSNKLLLKVSAQEAPQNFSIWWNGSDFVALTPEEALEQTKKQEKVNSVESWSPLPRLLFAPSMGRFAMWTVVVALSTFSSRFLQYVPPETTEEASGRADVQTPVAEEATRVSSEPQTNSVAVQSDDWPGDSAFTIVLESVTDKAEAQMKKTQALEKGLEAGVLLSTSYKSLRPGYWVVFSGLFTTEAEAQQHRRHVSSLGYGTPYVRLVHK